MLMGLREEILSTLRCSAAQHIRFSFTSVHGDTVSVDHTSFERVASAIVSGAIRIVRSTASDDGDASYGGDEAGNPFEVAPLHHRRMQEAIVLHEAVHASFDLTRSVINRLDNEVAAYIAGTVYLRRTGFPRVRYAGTFEEVALPAVSSIIHHGAPTADDLTRIRGALERDPEYHRDIHWGCTVSSNSCYLIDRGNG
jgi:hypothetical protein